MHGIRQEIYKRLNKDMIKTFEEAFELASNLDHLAKQERSKLEISRPVFMNAMRIEHNSDQRKKLNFSNARLCYHCNKPGYHSVNVFMPHRKIVQKLKQKWDSKENTKT